MASATWPGWEQQVQEAGGWPITSANARFLDQWQPYESGPPGPPVVDYNPYNVSYLSNYPTFGAQVDIFPSGAVGARETASRISGGLFPSITNALESGDPYAYAAQHPGAMQYDFQTWVHGPNAPHDSAHNVYGGWDVAGTGGPAPGPGGSGGSGGPTSGKATCDPATITSKHDCEQAGGTWTNNGGLYTCDCGAAGGGQQQLGIGGDIGSIVGSLFGAGGDVGALFKEAALRVGEFLIGLGLLYIGIRGFIAV